MNDKLSIIRVGYIGLEERDVLILKSVLNLINGRKKISWKCHQTTKADLLIARHHSDSPDLDHPLSLSAHKIAWTSDSYPKTISDQYILSYPFRGRELLQLFEAFSEIFPPPATVSSSPAQDTQSIYRLGQALEQALYGMDFFKNDIYIGRLTKHSFTSASSWLETEKISLTNFHWNEAETESLPAARSDIQIELEYNFFIWKFVLYSLNSLNQLGISSSSLIRLTRWPDFSQISDPQMKRNILRAACLLMQTSLTLEQLVQQAQTNESNLTQLLGAGILCNWIQISPQAAHQIKDNDDIYLKPPPSAKKNRFGEAIRTLRQVLGLN